MYARPHPERNLRHHRSAERQSLDWSIKSCHQNSSGILSRIQKVLFFGASFKPEDFLFLNEMFESGQIKPVVEKIFPLEKISEAMHHLGTGHAKAKIIVTMA